MCWRVRVRERKRDDDAIDKAKANTTTFAKHIEWVCVLHSTFPKGWLDFALLNKPLFLRFCYIDKSSEATLPVFSANAREIHNDFAVRVNKNIIEFFFSFSKSVFPSSIAHSHHIASSSLLFCNWSSLSLVYAIIIYRSCVAASQNNNWLVLISKDIILSKYIYAAWTSRNERKKHTKTTTTININNNITLTG